MKRLLQILLYIFTSIIAFGQVDSVNYYIPKIQMTISIPPELKMHDATEHPGYADSLGNPITDSLHIEQFKKFTPENLLTIAMVDNLTNLTVNIVPINLISINLDDSTESEKTKRMVVLAAKQVSENFDTVFEKVKIGNIIFDKSVTLIKMKDKVIYYGGYIAKTKDYYLSVGFSSTDKIIGDKLIRAIETAKFK